MAGEKIAGVPRNYAIAGIAVAVGVIGYAWWKQGDAGSAEVVDPGLEASVDEYDSPLGNSGTNSSGSFAGNVDEDRIDTNAEWSQAAVEFLQGAGYDASAVISALGKYLEFKPLSATEAQIVMAARAAVGEPPVGGPYPIKDALPNPTPTSIKPGPVTGLRTYSQSANTIWLDWNDVKDSRGYDIVRSDEPNSPKTSLTSSFTSSGLKSKKSYTYKVRARPNVGSTPGDWATITVKTK